MFKNWESSIHEYEMLFDEIIENERKISLDEKQTEIVVRRYFLKYRKN